MSNRSELPYTSVTSDLSYCRYDTGVKSAQFFETPDQGLYLGYTETISEDTKTYVFARQGNNSDYAEDRNAWVYLYYLKIAKGGTVVRDLIPVKTILGEVGLYDKITGRFFTSETNTPFIASPEYPTISGYTWLEYIESTSTGG
jgi:hypothetical protein